MNDKIIPVILCGGNGTRLWPLSRESFPKQYLSLDSNDKMSFLQKTQKRLKGLDNAGSPIIICNENHRFIVAEQMRELSITPKKILLEPFGRNTAPAIALSALIALESEVNPTLLVLSSDHEIEDDKGFLNIIKSGLTYSNNNNLVTFGVVPDYAETGYGYIQGEEPFDEKVIKGTKIINFIEKPSRKIASELIKDKCFTWNSGIFLFKAKNILSEIQKFAPNVLNSCKKSIDKKSLDLDFQRLDKDSFKECPSISIDYAVMEKTNKGIVLPMNVGWRDVGNWNSVWEKSKKDEQGNAVQGKVLLEKTNNSIFRSENRLVVGIGVKDLIVIETSDVVLVANRNKAQEIKNIVEKIINQGMYEGYEHKKIFRPWGHYISLVEDTRWKVKLILVKPQEKLSLQRHRHRSEHWIIVNGIANVEIGNKKITLKENQSSYIPLGVKHRLSNPGNIPLKLIEVQSGNYLGEDDIERFEDNYGRVNKLC